MKNKKKLFLVLALSLLTASLFVYFYKKGSTPPESQNIEDIVAIEKKITAKVEKLRETELKKIQELHRDAKEEFEQKGFSSYPSNLQVASDFRKCPNDKETATTYKSKINISLDKEKGTYIQELVTTEPMEDFSFDCKSFRSCGKAIHGTKRWVFDLPIEQSRKKCRGKEDSYSIEGVFSEREYICLDGSFYPTLKTRPSNKKIKTDCL